MRLDEITRPESRRAADQLLRDKGYTRLGAGSFGAIYQNKTASYVLKVFSSTDFAYIDFIKLCQSNQNPHLPKFFGKLVKVTDLYYAIRMEKLTPFTYDQGDYVADKISEYCRGPQSSRFEDSLEYLEDKPELSKACKLIRTLKHPLDLKYDNVMKRGSTVVIVDPVKNEQTSSQETLPYVDPKQPTEPASKTKLKWSDEDAAMFDELFGSNT